MLTDDQGKPIHFPANPGKFEFDAEVAQVFPNMAERSIPNYHLAHHLHVQMAGEWLRNPMGCRILDVGASRGAFLEHIKQAGHTGFRYQAVDNSLPMLDQLVEEYPEAEALNIDVSSSAFETFLLKNRPFDIVCCYYVLQFLPPHRQLDALDMMLRAVRPGGLFIIGHKAKHAGDLGDLAHERYIDFRVKNGYTREEIQAKTLALKGSMFPMLDSEVQGFLQLRCREVQETTRFMMFSTLIAKK